MCYIFNTLISYRHCVVCKEASHAASAILDSEWSAIVSVGAARGRVKLDMVV